MRSPVQVSLLNVSAMMKFLRSWGNHQILWMRRMGTYTPSVAGSINSLSKMGSRIIMGSSNIYINYYWLVTK
jgi:hypothetical protein